jgi:hypothetical protein
MWRDEVRAFSVAIQAQSWPELLHDIHQDGHPILWYAILRVGYAITHSPLVLPITALLIAWGAAFLILRFAPFPVWMRVLTVFGAFLGHEFSVIARNYGIGILLMVVACIFFPARRERPLRLGVVLALLANTSVHAALAALLLAFVWVGTDVLDKGSRRTLAQLASLGALLIVAAGVAFGLWSAHVPADMTYAVSLTQVLPNRWGVIPLDPAAAVMGVQLSNIAAAGELPWARIGLDPSIMSRLIVDVALIGILWSLRKNPVCLAAAVLAFIAFALLFRLVYSGSLRHEGMLAFILISLVWIAIQASRERTANERRAMALGLLPLVFFQAVALPVTARRVLKYPTSSSRAFAADIERNPAWREAILAGEPDYIMEPMPYYVRNPVFMPRQREYDYRVYFDRGAKRKLDLRLGDLIDLADSLSCANARPVLLAIGYEAVLAKPEGEEHPAYTGTVFRWNDTERARLLAEGRRVGSFMNATSDENYYLFEFRPRRAAECASSPGPRD